MKSFAAQTIRMTSLALLLVGPVTVGQSQTYPISVKVSPDDHSANGAAIPNTTVKTETRTEKLEILLQNTTPASYSNLIVRYCIFDQDVQSQKIASALQHETHITLPAFAGLILTSEVARITYAPSHIVTTKSKSTKKGEPETIKETPVKATGKMFSGYGVQILQPDLAGPASHPLHATNLIVGLVFSSWDLTNQFKAAFGGAKKTP